MVYGAGVLQIVPAPGAQFNDIDLSIAAGGQVLVSARGGPPGSNQQLIVFTR
jgi:hypothetical protein